MNVAQAKATATLVRTVRQDWDYTRLVNVCLDSRLADKPLPDIARAFVAGAQDPGIRTPDGLLFMDRPHWQPPKATYAPENISRGGIRCAVCNKPRPAHEAMNALVAVEDRHAWEATS